MNRNCCVLWSLLIFAATCAYVAAENPIADQFRSAWKAAEPAFESGSPSMCPTVEIAPGGTVTLVNRGMLISRNGVEHFRLKFRWTWVEGQLPVYPDHLAVVFRTDGKRRPWAFEIQQGLVVRFNPAGAVILEEWNLGEAAGQVIARTPHKFKMHKPYNISITDNGDSVTIRIDGSEVLMARVDPKRTASLVGFYNRESVAGVRKVSVLEGITLKPLK